MNNNELKNLTIEAFPNKNAAELAFEEAVKLGYKPNEINILISEESRNQYYAQQEDENPPTKNLAVGGALGGAIGGTIGALVALGTNIALPGLGLVIAGPLAGAGSVSGGLLGSLIGWTTELPEDESLGHGLKQGAILLGVEEKKGMPSVKEAWKKHSTYKQNRA